MAAENALGVASSPGVEVGYGEFASASGGGDGGDGGRATPSPLGPGPAPRRPAGHATLTVRTPFAASLGRGNGLVGWLSRREGGVRAAGPRGGGTARGEAAPGLRGRPLLLWLSDRSARVAVVLTRSGVEPARVPGRRDEPAEGALARIPVPWVGSVAVVPASRADDAFRAPCPSRGRASESRGGGQPGRFPRKRRRPSWGSGGRPEGSRVEPPSPGSFAEGGVGEQGPGARGMAAGESSRWAPGVGGDPCRRELGGDEGLVAEGGGLDEVG